jgi:hypothetical protein
MRRQRTREWPWTVPSADVGAVSLRGTPGAALPPRERGPRVDIRDLPEDAGHIRERVPVTLVHSAGVRRSSRKGRAEPEDLPVAGQIVDDRLDGRRVYPEPPRRDCVRDRRRRLADRLTPATIPFLLVAWTQVLIVAADAWSAAAWNPVDIAATIARAAYLGGLAALPATVLMWRPDAIRSAPLVLLGAMVWTLAASLTGIAWWFTQLDPGAFQRYGHDVALVGGIAAVLTCLGPVLVSYGLERTRRSPIGWYASVVLRLAAVAAVALVFNVIRWLPIIHQRGVATPGLAGGSMDATHVAGTVAGAVEPIMLFSFLTLALSATSAVSADEAQRRLWQGIAVGAAVLMGVSLYQFGSGVEFSHLVMAGQHAPAGFGGLAVTSVLAAGVVLLVGGFSSPLWSRAPDAEGWGRGAPKEIFAWGSTGATGTSDPIPMAAIVALAAGADHALAVDTLGRVGAWGTDARGQTDVPEGLDGVISVAAGDGFSLALRADGSVVAWGDGELGQTRVPEGLSDVTAIAAGGAFALALRTDGTVVAWGDERCEAVRVPDGLAGVVSIAAGASHALALGPDGSVTGWGDDTYGQASVPAIGPARAISAGASFSLALRADGTVVAWGDGRYGQLDLPGRMPRDVVAISAGAYHALALRAGGDVIGWGGGSQGQDEATHPWHLVDFKAIAAGDGFSLAIRAPWSPLYAASESLGWAEG